MFLATAALAAALTIRDYATMPTLSEPVFSPDGKRIAYVLTAADLEKSAYQSDVWVVDADGSNDLQLTHARGNDGEPAWSPDGKAIAFLSDRDGRSAVWIMDARGGEAWKLTSVDGRVQGFSWAPDGRSIAFTMTDAPGADEERLVRDREDVHVVGASARYTHLYAIDVDTREVHRLTRGTFSVNNFTWSPDGRTIALERIPEGGLDDLYRTDLYTVDASVFCNDNSCPKMTPLVVRPGVDRAPQFSPDGKWIAFLSTGGAYDWLREHDLWVIDVATGKPRAISAGLDRTIENFHWSGSSAIVFDAPDRTTSQLFRADVATSRVTPLSSVAGLVADSAVDPTSGRAVFVEQTLTTPPELYASGTAPFAPRQLTHHNDALRNAQLGETRLIRWKNPSDGLEIEGLLTLPTGYRAGTRVPLLTFVHGGPASRFDQGFLGYLGSLYAPQVLASKGFAVLRPNPRGTGGYGEAFRRANVNDWGGMDWVDINAGIDKVIADGIADPQRLGIMGWSYGGFMTSWAEGHSDRFKAISIGAPVVDLLSFHGTTDIRRFIPGYFPGKTRSALSAGPAAAVDSAGLEALAEAPLDLDALRAHSPLWHLQPSKAHVLIQQGEADERVPTSQGTMLYRMLDELGVDVRMVTYPRSHHVPREPKQRIDVMTRNVEFFEKYVPRD